MNQGRLIHRDSAKVGGAAHLKGTMVTVWMLVQCKQQGLTDAEVLKKFPQLTQEDLTSAWHFTQHSAHEVQADFDTHVPDEATPSPTQAPQGHSQPTPQTRISTQPHTGNPPIQRPNPPDKGAAH